MMYARLILRNLKRSTKEYAIYFYTLTIAVALMYAFNGIALSKDVQSLSKHMDVLAGAMVLVSILIVFVMGWLVYYISNYILQRRSKEFGMYMLMGISKKQLSLMFFMEQVCMGLLAFILGCFLGAFLYQIILAIINQLFMQTYHFSFLFSWKGSAITFVYFVFIFLLELIRERYILRKKQIRELLYSEKKNDIIKNNGKLGGILFLVGIVCFFAGLWFLHEAFIIYSADLGSYLLCSLIAFILSICLMFFSCSFVLKHFLQKRKSLQYHGNVLYLGANITTRLRNSRAVLCLLSILTLSTLFMVTLGIKLNETQKKTGDAIMPFDIMVEGRTPFKTDMIPTYLDSHSIDYQDLSYQLYTMNFDVSPLVKGVTKNQQSLASEANVFLRYSDYQTLMKYLDKKPQSLFKDEYLILTSEDIQSKIRKNANTFTWEGLRCKSVDIDYLGQTGYSLFFFVVPDEVLEAKTNMEANKLSLSYKYIVKTKQPSEKEWYQDLQSSFYENENGVKTYQGLMIKYNLMETNMTSTIIIVFSLIYVAIIFTCVSATVLAIHQMSDIWKQKESYNMLQKMGMNRKDIRGLLKKQIAIYFFVPLLIPLLFILPIVNEVNALFEATYARNSMIPYAISATLCYLSIYFLYYLMAYYSAKRSIEES